MAGILIMLLELGHQNYGENYILQGGLDDLVWDFHNACLKFETPFLQQLGVGFGVELVAQG